ncbi:MAG: TetR/AcrR family transcriptional regulator [Lachnospiraceae bacterium]|nr:TetR/AcrR family transcriptional regulator [Lachnospiraceae bacterium]
MNRKEEIIYATLEIASVNGMKGVSMAQIADKVGIKAPSLYNHFRSKEELIREMYGFLREKAQKNNRSRLVDYTKLFEEKNLEEILLSSVSSYVGMISNTNMLQFFKTLYSERSTDPTAAGIMVEETERMLAQSKELFYALAVHGKIKNQNADMAAVTYSLTVHSLIDYRMDKITAGELKEFGDENSSVPEEITDFIKWFSNMIGGNDDE